jgi:Zn-dependent peptidase ImmA (M78 family)
MKRKRDLLPQVIKRIHELHIQTEYVCPVNLFHVAEIQSVLEVHLCPTFGWGNLEVVHGGYVIRIKHDKDVFIKPSKHIIYDSLTNRQRFTFAHELVHTMFYDSSGDIPKSQNAIDSTALERLCDSGAGYLLIPWGILKQMVNRDNPLTLSTIEKCEQYFHASQEVIMRQANILSEDDKSDQIGIFLMERIEGYHLWKIIAYYCRNTIRMQLGLPTLYKNTERDITPFIFSNLDVLRFVGIEGEGYDLRIKKLDEDYKRTLFEYRLTTQPFQ